MKKMIFPRIGFAVALALLFPLAGCGTSDDEAAADEGETADTNEQTADTVVEVMSVTSTAANESLEESDAPALAVNGVKLTAVDVSVDCPTGGTATAGGTVDEPAAGDVDLDITMTACETATGTLSGTLTVSGTYSGSGPYTVDVTVDETINGEDCDVTFDELTLDGTFDGTSATGTITGSATYDCAGSAGSCTWAGVDLTSADDIAAGCESD